MYLLALRLWSSISSAPSSKLVCHPEKIKEGSNAEVATEEQSIQIPYTSQIHKK